VSLRGVIFAMAGFVGSWPDLSLGCSIQGEDAWSEASVADSIDSGCALFPAWADAECAVPMLRSVSMTVLQAHMHCNLD